jgi:hypothetical protein
MPTMIVATTDAALQDLVGRETNAGMKAFFPPHHQKLFASWRGSCLRPLLRLATDL